MAFFSILLKSSAVYVLSNVLNSAIPFIMLPILTRYLSPTDYGIVAIFQVIIALLAPVTGLSVQSAISKTFVNQDEVDLPTYIFNCLLILAASSATTGLCMILFAQQVASLTAFPKSWLWTTVVCSSLQFLIMVVLTVWQARIKPLAYGTFLISQSAVNMGLSLWFVIGLERGWQGRIEAQLISVTAFAVIGLLMLHHSGWVRYRLNFAYIRHALKFGVPLVPHAIGMWALNMVDRVFVTRMVGVSAAGVYAVGCQLGMVIQVAQTSFSQAWTPWIFQQLKVNNPIANRRIVKFTYLYFAALLAISIAYGLISPHIVKILVGPQFSEASAYVIWIGLGFAFQGMYKMVNNYILFAEKTHLLAGVTFITALVNLGLNYILIKYHGALGAAEATAYSYLLSFLLTWIVAARAFPMPYALWRKDSNLRQAALQDAR